jgi:cell wall-associated NlpC family hydrolase
MQFTDYIGIPFAEHGRDRNGVDCYGLVRMVMAEIYGVATKDFLDYKGTRPTDCADLFRAAQTGTEWVKVPTPDRGDIVLFRILGLPAHCGIYIGGSDFLHASHEVGVCVERLSVPHWAKRVVGFYRHRERNHG